MTLRTTVTREDDLDGSPAHETLRFGIDGPMYEIDLSEKNAARFRQQLAPFIEHARKAATGQRRPVRTTASRQRSRDIRAWAKEQGIPLSDRGRIPASIYARYDAARAKRGSRGRLCRHQPETGGRRLRRLSERDDGGEQALGVRRCAFTASLGAPGRPSFARQHVARRPFWPPSGTFHDFGSGSRPVRALLRRSVD